MRSVLRVGMLAVLFVAAGTLPPAPADAAAQSRAPVLDAALKARVESQFRVLPVRGGVVLTPRRTIEGVESIEIRDGLIALDGEPTTGAQLRERLGDAADLVLQVSYLPIDALVNWNRAPEPSTPPATPDAPQVPAAPESAGAPAQPPPSPPPSRPRVRPEAGELAPNGRPWRQSASRVRIGGSVTVHEDEYVTEPVVAVGGSVTVLGRVDDDVVAVGGSVRLGPHARVRGDVTAVGGGIDQEPGAWIGGSVNEVGFGVGSFHFEPWAVGLPWWSGHEMFSGSFKLLGTILRVSLVLLLAMVVALVAARPVERIAERATREPWVSGFVGLLAQLLFVPVLVLTVVVLAISIIGIPLLVLVPLGVLAFLAAFLVGFTGLALRIGSWAAPGRSPFVALAVGVVLVAAVTLLARLLALLPVPLWPITWVVALAGFLIEYVVWTMGLGAALLTRFGTRGASPPPASTQPPPVEPPPLPAV